MSRRKVGLYPGERGKSGAGGWRSRAVDSGVWALMVQAGLCCVSAVSPVLAGDPVPVFEKGLPETAIPTFREKGAPEFHYPTGSPVSDGPGNGVPANGNNGNSGISDVNYNACRGCDPLQKMMAQPWGADAAEAARRIGITPEALASTCVLESDCRSINGKGTVSGAFQMTNATYRQEIDRANNNNPGLNLDTSFNGKMDPANQAYASAQYQFDGAHYLQRNGIENPTIMDVRSFYQFGPEPAARLATARTSENLESIVNLSPANMAANGITSTTTVGDWRQRIANRLGPVAMHPVLK